MAQPPVKQEENFSFQLIFLLICLELSSSLHLLLEKKKKRVIDMSFITKTSFPSAEQIAQNGTNICVNMLAATKNPRCPTIT